MTKMECKVGTFLITSRLLQDFYIHPPKFKQLDRESWWLEDDPFLLGPGNFSGASRSELYTSLKTNT